MATRLSASTVRDATKWLLAAFAAVYASLLAGIQLNISSFPEAGQPVVAVGAAILAMGAAIWAIVRASGLLVHPELSLDDLLHMETSLKINQRHLAELDDSGGHKQSTEELIVRTVAQNQSLMHNTNCSPIALRDALHIARRNNDRTAQDFTLADISNALEIANSVKFHALFRRLRFVSTFAALVITASTLIFIWALFADADQSTEVSSPAAGDLIFSDSSTSATIGLGANCEVTEVRAIAIGGTWEEPYVVIAPSENCEAIEIRVTNEIGQFLPDTA